MKAPVVIRIKSFYVDANELNNVNSYRAVIFCLHNSVFLIIILISELLEESLSFRPDFTK